MIGVRPSPLLAPPPTLSQAPLWPAQSAAPVSWPRREVVASALLVTLPVFLQAPWVRLSPASATVFTALLVAVGVMLNTSPDARRRDLGSLLVGFAGSWLAGSLFWGWARLHPLWHLPIEAFALPLALTGMGGRWRLACGFYLGSLLGTAATDGAIALIGLMPLWPRVLGASPAEASQLLHSAGLQVLQPWPLLLVAAAAALLGALSRWLGGRGAVGRVAGAALLTTLAVDGLFLLAALLAPRLSGVI